MNVLGILLDGAPAGGSGFGSMSSILMIVLLFVVMYFFMIRPQQKKQKEIQKMREALKVGDKVITSGGVYGKLKEINDSSYTVEIAENTRIKVDKASVFAVTEQSSK
ncbi:MAG: preprotein translocase subunit YajC [Dysgonamonadaceae bacterium]|jgi:preprotein translocase subunit YajC|nr:preprotein translocase subunit YajC [Dysgonamonadaceae bacterium]